MPLFFPRVEAHTTAYNHLVCTNMTTPQQDMVQLDIRTHLKSGAIPTGANDGYIYNDPPEDPRGAVHPTEDPGTQVLYRVISQAPSAAYIASQKINGESDLTCNIDLTCKDTCDIPAESGRCDSGCNITLQTGSCPQYNKSASFDVYTGNTDTFIRWDDGSTNTMVTPQPSPQTKSHTFTNPGKYDVTVRCASQVCHKRFNVACQDGAANPTLTPLPTTTPAGGTSCMSPLRCSHPCSCDPSSTSYTNAHCDQLESTYDYSSGYGSSQGTTDGMACSPGLVCCKPAQATSKAWYKTKDVDFHELGGLANSIPSNATAFNATDAGDCNPDDGNALNCHIIGKGGLVSANGGINLGMSVSNKNIWRLGSSTYRKDTQMTPDSYIQYLRSRKETVNIDDPEDVQNDKVNYLSGDQTIYVIDDNGMQGKAPFILLLDNGSLRFDLSNKFNSSNKSMVIVVDGTIEFKSNMTEVNGIFIANNFDFAFDIAEGSTTTTTFWLNGNIISMNDVNCAEKRQRADQTKPSCFFTFDFVNQYLPVLSLFSSKTYKRAAN